MVGTLVETANLVAFVLVMAVRFCLSSCLRVVMVQGLFIGSGGHACESHSGMVFGCGHECAN
jgi:hypothetical protein